MIQATQFEVCDLAPEYVAANRLLRHVVLDPARDFPIELAGDELDELPETIVKIGLLDGEVVSTVRAVPLTPTLYKIGKVAAAGHVRGTDIAATTFQEAERSAIAQGAQRFTLDSRPWQPYRFHRRMGFIDTGQTVWQPFGVLSHVMEKEVV